MSEVTMYQELAVKSPTREEGRVVTGTKEWQQPLNGRRYEISTWNPSAVCKLHGQILKFRVWEVFLVTETLLQTRVIEVTAFSGTWQGWDYIRH